MKKSRIWVFGWLLLPALLRGQNLVSNGSFEQYSSCPDDLFQIDRALGWSAIVGSPDYFNACSDTVVTGVPANGVGYQHASDGQAYIGSATYATGQLAREPVQAELTMPMEIGQLHFLSMRVSPGGFGSIQSYTAGLASSGIGLRFSTIALDWSLDLLDNAPVLHMSSVLEDTSQWTTLAGYYVPDSAYRFVQIGNFFTDAATQSQLMDPGALTMAAYAFIDDVCVSALPGVCASPDGTPEGPNDGSGMAITYGLNGITLSWSISARVGQGLMHIYDGAGRVVWQSSVLCSDSVLIETSVLAPGLYSARLQFTTGVVHTSKFVLHSH